ncbi:MAG: hypothetical protein RIC12_00685 [Pirellulales bacterium]
MVADGTERPIDQNTRIAAFWIAGFILVCIVVEVVAGYFRVGEVNLYIGGPAILGWIAAYVLDRYPAGLRPWVITILSLAIAAFTLFWFAGIADWLFDLRVEVRMNYGHRNVNLLSLAGVGFSLLFLVGVVPPFLLMCTDATQSRRGANAGD